MEAKIIGVGGIGSWLVDELTRLSEAGVHDYMLTVYDDDLIECKNIKQLQNYSLEDIGRPKVLSLCERYPVLGICERAFPAEDDLAEGKGDLKADFVFLCVDNDNTRAKMIKELEATRTPYLDCRASGRRVLVTSNSQKFTDEGDLVSYSCQEEIDNERGHLQLGFKIAAIVASQMFLNHIRGHENQTFFKVI